VIVVDDGIATGPPMSAAFELLRHKKAVRFMVAGPLDPMDPILRLRGEPVEAYSVSAPKPSLPVTVHDHLRL